MKGWKLEGERGKQAKLDRYKLQSDGRQWQPGIGGGDLVNCILSFGMMAIEESLRVLSPSFREPRHVLFTSPGCLGET